MYAGRWFDRYAKWRQCFSPNEWRDLEYYWPFWARREQLPPISDWSIWLLMAGRGFGKTRAGAEWVQMIAEDDGCARIALVAANLAEARMVMVEGASGLLSIGAPRLRPKWEPSLRRLRWWNGAEAQVYSAAEPDSLRGPEHSHAWCDEIGKWVNNRGQALASWDNLKMGLRRGERPQIVATTTPRPVALVRKLVKQDIALTSGQTVDNSVHLPDMFLDDMAANYAGTRLGRQELLGQLIEDVEGALWTRAMIDHCQRRADDMIDPDELVRIVIGVDPPASSEGDACGIIAAGRDQHGNAHVLADDSAAGQSPEQWAKIVAGALSRWNADRVVAESNQGGEMVRTVLQAVAIELPVTLVHATRGKTVRAEPVAALYETGKVFHAAGLSELEDQLCGLLVGGEYVGPGRSPDRADALVWALTNLMLGSPRRPQIRQLD